MFFCINNAVLHLVILTPYTLLYLMLKGRFSPDFDVAVIAGRKVKSQLLICLNRPVCHSPEKMGEKVFISYHFEYHLNIKGSAIRIENNSGHNHCGTAIRLFALQNV